MVKTPEPQVLPNVAKTQGNSSIYKHMHKHNRLNGGIGIKFNNSAAQQRDAINETEEDDQADEEADGIGEEHKGPFDEEDSQSNSEEDDQDESSLTVGGQ